MPKKYIVTLTIEEQEHLRDLIARRNEKATAVKKTYVLLAADKNGQDLCDREIRQSAGQACHQ